VGCKTLRASGAYALCEDDTIADTAHKLIHALICKLLLHEFGTYRGEDVEALHDMRVTARRLRTAVRIFRPYLENGDEVEEAVHRLAKGFKRLTKAMGPVRDLDVFRQRTEREFINSNAEEASLLDSLARAWDTAYVPARNYLACYLESPRHKDFKTTLLTSLTSALTAPEAQGPVLEIIPDILETRLCAIQTWAEAAEDPNAAMDTLHSLRLEIKRLRYTLEFFRPLLNPAADRAIEHLIRAQDHLGDLQDTTFSYRHWQAVRSWGMWDLPDQPETLWRLSKPEPLPMASLYLETECQAMERLRTGVPEMWAESAPVFTEAVTTIIEIMRDKVSKIRYNHTH
jgi:CHAD domain-containing protein